MKTKIDSYDALIQARRDISREIQAQKEVLGGVFFEIRSGLTPLNIVGSMARKAFDCFNWAEIGLAAVRGIRKSLLKR